MDKIEIRNLEIFANHGVFPEENVLGQKFVISATLYTDTRKAGLTDELTASIHYGEVSHMITKFTKEHTFKLLETLAENLCQMLLQELPFLKMITLRVEKPWAPVGLPLDTVAVEITRGWHTAYVAFGSNLGDKKKFLDDGIQGLKDTPLCEVEAVSEYLVTEPYGGVEQDEFLNGVLKLRTLLTPEELLDRLHELEAAANRERIIHWGPRTLDLDILFYDNEIIETPDLHIPNIDMENRIIQVEKQLQVLNHKHVVLPTKTTNGVRSIPMTDGVYESFERVLKNRYLKGEIEPVCYDEKGGAYEGFVFLATRTRRTIVRDHVEEYLRNCIKRFNNANPDNPIREFYPHICRHTFATNMQYLPPKTLQYILGHGNISTTMNNYVSVKPSAEQLVQINEMANRIIAN